MELLQEISKNQLTISEEFFCTEDEMYRLSAIRNPLTGVYT